MSERNASGLALIERARLLRLERLADLGTLICLTFTAIIWVLQ